MSSAVVGHTFVTLVAQTQRDEHRPLANDPRIDRGGIRRDDRGPAVHAPAAGDGIGIPRHAVHLQLGDLPKLTSSESVRVLWQAVDDDEVKWTVDVRQGEDAPWRPAIASAGRLIRAIGSLPSYRLFSVPLTRLQPGRAFEYRVSKNGEPVFSARGRARAPASEPYRFVVTGDTGADTPQERRIVHQIHRADPAFFAIAGDIVYSTGRQSEYRQKFFPGVQRRRGQRRHRRAAHAIATLIRGLRQPRRGHRRPRARS